MQGIQDLPDDDRRKDHDMRMTVDLVLWGWNNWSISQDEALRALFDADVPAEVAGRVLA